jgi:hypothetical protein
MTRCTCGAGHPTYGACLRAKNIRIGYCQSWKNFDATRTKNNERELAEYANARRQGIQPAGTQIGQTRSALDMSDRLGRPYDAGSTSSIIEME